MNNIERYENRKKKRLVKRMWNADSADEAERLGIAIYNNFAGNHRFDADNDIDWITMENGVHVPINKSNGTAIGGPVKGQNLSEAKSENAESSGESKTGGIKDYAATKEQWSKAEEKFGELTPNSKFIFLTDAGIIPQDEETDIRIGLWSNDEDSIERLNYWQDEYFADLMIAEGEKSLDCPGRDDLLVMPEDERMDWIKESANRYLTDEEAEWANSNAAQRLAIDLGMNKTPQVVCGADFDKYVEETGADVIYRGVVSTDELSAENMQYQALYDTSRPYIGDGIYGDGLYFSKNEGEAYAYSDGDVLTCALRPDAKVMTYESPSEDYKTTKEKGFNDPGVAAMASGYDAIYVQSKGYYVILNKAAMIAKNPMDEMLTSLVNGEWEYK